MTPWVERSREERSLLNPAFCAVLIWHAARGCESVRASSLSFEESFLVLPFVLHRTTREALPRDTRTSLAVWLNENPLAQGRISSRARLLATCTKEALLFGGSYGLLHLESGTVQADEALKREVARSLTGSSVEVRGCAQRAEFVGKWFGIAGSGSTVLAMVGVRP
jgi:hypothetical protein